MDPTPALIQKCAPQVAPETVAAVIRTESGGNPLAININYRRTRLARRASSMTEAIGWAKWLIQHGYNIDMGLMQVNSRQLQRLKLSVDHIFDPCTNISAGSRILTENYLKARDKYGHGQNALFASLSAYNTGHFQRGIKNGYVSRVVRNAGKPVTIQSSSRKVRSKSPTSKTTVTAQKTTHHPTQHARVYTQKYQAASSPYNATTGISMNTPTPEQTFTFVR